MNFVSKSKWLKHPNQTRTGAMKKCERELAVFIKGTRANFSRELGIEVDSGEQFGISFTGTVKKIRE